MYKMMIVDDEPLTREYMKYNIPLLNDKWQVVSEAMEGSEALELLKYKPVDLIVTDIKMPVMDGLELCRKLSEKHLVQKIIILSGYDEFAFAREALRYGVSEYILKPIVKDELKKALDRVTEQIETENNREIAYKAMTGIYPCNDYDDQDIIAKAKQYIYTHYSEPISLALVAEKTGVSSGYLSNIFHKNVGESYIKFVTRIRMEQAERLLKIKPLQKIQDISEKVGYISVKHFSYVFKKYFNMSPSEYQQKYTAV